MSAINQIETYLNAKSEGKVIETERWLHFLATADSYLQNLEHVHSVHERSATDLLQYVLRSLKILDSLKLNSEDHGIIETVLKWSEVAKGGSHEQIQKWRNNGINLSVHNEGSATIYLHHAQEVLPENSTVKLIFELIRTHGLLGQFLRGESELISNKTLVLALLDYDPEEAHNLLYHLNACVIGGVSLDLWDNVKDDISYAIRKILFGSFDEELISRITKMRKQSDDSIQSIQEHILSNQVKMESFFAGKEFWYVEPALKEFSFSDFWTFFEVLAERLKGDSVKHIHFGQLMNQMHYDYQGKKHINIYRKRIIEKYLEECRQAESFDNAHVSLQVEQTENGEVAHVSFKFSDMGEALINFSVEAEKADIMHSRALVLLYDFFGLRKDAYDRLHNEQNYLADMNSAADDKAKILDFLTGERIVDVGPGGGVLLDLIEEGTQGKEIIGVDISENVIQELNAKKTRENRSWQAVKADALNLSKVIKSESVGTVIFSSVLHELFSYITYDGKRFNYDVIRAALESAFSVLKPGGRIIIRDGIMDERQEAERIIRFKDPNGMKWLKDYQSQFKGREIQVAPEGDKQVRMPVNDALEFLYTYTWGDEAFSHEVNEQFAYFTPQGFQNFVNELFGEAATIVHFSHYLQEGYPLNLADKIELYDLGGNETPLPDSTCLLVIEKNK